MQGRIEWGQVCTLEPATPEALQPGEIVLCKVNGRHYLCQIKAVQEEWFQIGNNRGRINGWISAGAIYGRCSRVE